MKKTVTLPDGTTEVLEGTPEEIAQHEKLIRERVGDKPVGRKKPDVLKGAPDVVPTGESAPARFDPEIIKKLQELIETTKENRRVTPWYELMPPPSCSICGMVGCRSLHGEQFWPQTYITAQYSVTDNKTSDALLTGVASGADLGWSNSVMFWQSGPRLTS